jgi:hypothetical protein
VEEPLGGSILVLLLIALAGLLLLVWSLFKGFGGLVRLVAGPSMKARPGGLGSDYELMIQAQRGGRRQHRVLPPRPELSAAQTRSKSMASLPGRFWGLRRAILPHWIAWPLCLLGLVFVVFVPFGIDWFDYASGLVLAAGFGWWSRRRYAVAVLERSERGWVVWIRRRMKEGEPAPEAWRAAHEEAELAEFDAWRAAKAAAGPNPVAARPEPPSPLPTDSF